jgi:ComF family protein
MELPRAAGGFAKWPALGLRRGADALIAVLLAPACAACGTPLGAPTRGVVCDGCWGGIVPFAPPLCLRCGEPLPSWRRISRDSGTCARCRRAPSPIALAGAVGDYEGPLRSIVHALKYGQRRSVAMGLAARMRERCPAVLEGADAVVPVPLHWRRRRRRGFNQAADLATHLGLPVLDVLKRVRATPTQTGLRAGARRANVRGAFVLRRNSIVAGRRLVLVDDVSTTGATLEACASALRDAGAADVRAVTAARVVRRRRE